MTVRALTAAAAAIVLTAAVVPGNAAATPPEGDSVRTDLAKGTTETPVSTVINGPATLVVQAFVMEPGASSGWHTHPGTELSVINEGSVVLQTAMACWPVTYSAGQAVFIPAGVPHRVANESGQDADVVVTYTLPADATVRGDSPDACAR